MKATFKLTPESEEFLAKISVCDKRYPAAANKISKVLAEKTVMAVKRLILDQNFAELALSPQWAAYKRRKGLDPRTLIATTQYLRSIKIKRASYGNWGVQCDLDKAGWLERGSGGRQRKRKHWEPVITTMAAASPRIAEALMREIVFHGDEKLARE